MDLTVVVAGNGIRDEEKKLWKSVGGCSFGGDTTAALGANEISVAAVFNLKEGATRVCVSDNLRCIRSIKRPAKPEDRRSS